MTRSSLAILSLSCKTRPVKGVLAMAMLARETGKRGLIVPAESADEAALANNVSVYPVESLDHAVRFLNKEVDIEPKTSLESSFYRTPDEKPPRRLLGSKGTTRGAPRG